MFDEEADVHEEELPADEAEEVPAGEHVVSDLSNEEPPQPEQPPTVHIPVDRDEQGSVTVEVFATGDVRPTEVESILKLALKKWETKSGLG